ATGADADRAAIFVIEAERNGATTARIDRPEDLAGALGDYLEGIGEAPVVRAAPHPLLKDALSKQTRLEITEGPTTGADPVSLTAAFVAVAETGTLVLCSGPDSPTTLNFLPDTNIVLLLQSRIVGAYEDAWAVLRTGMGNGLMPRTVNWITGPSRSADIEQTLLMGAHGPRRLHIVMLNDKKNQ
ncbi:MAG: LutC/YkgG family protein, partial [Alphaproteobacteria bacterium]